MALTTRTTGSGLSLAEYTVGEGQLQRALKEFDDRLTLWPPDGVSPHYRVVYHVSDWQDAHVVCTWMDEHGRPLPLSSGLVEKVKQLHVGARNKPADVDEQNEERAEQVRRIQEERGRRIVEDHRAKVERGRVTVGISTQPGARYWRRNRRGPSSGGV